MATYLAVAALTFLISHVFITRTLNDATRRLVHNDSLAHEAPWHDDDLDDEMDSEDEDSEDDEDDPLWDQSSLGAPAFIVHSVRDHRGPIIP